MDSLVDAVEAADSAWPVIAIFLLGLYALLWKYGGELLKLGRKNAEAIVEAQEAASAAQESAKHVADSIKTNHGSKSIGDAIDKLTEDLRKNSRVTEETRRLADHLSTRLNDHIEHYGDHLQNNEPMIELGRQLLTQLQERVGDPEEDGT